MPLSQTSFTNVMRDVFEPAIQRLRKEIEDERRIDGVLLVKRSAISQMMHDMEGLDKASFTEQIEFATQIESVADAMDKRIYDAENAEKLKSSMAEDVERAKKDDKTKWCQSAETMRLARQHELDAAEVTIQSKVCDVMAMVIAAISGTPATTPHKLEHNQSPRINAKRKRENDNADDEVGSLFTVGSDSVRSKATYASPLKRLKVTAAL